MSSSLGRLVQASLRPGRQGGFDAGPIAIALEENQACSMLLRAGASVNCVSGTVWVTCEGDPTDHVLVAGEAFVSGGGGRLALMAFRPSCIRVEKRGTTSPFAPAPTSAATSLSVRTNSSEPARSGCVGPALRRHPRRRVTAGVQDASAAGTTGGQGDESTSDQRRSSDNPGGEPAVAREVMLVAAGGFLISLSPVFVQVASVDPTMAGFYRTLFGGVVLSAFAVTRGERLWRGRVALRWSAAAALFFGLGLTFWHRSIHAVGPGLSTILANLQAFFLAALATVSLKEREHALLSPW
jgi:hypothetical protein